MDIKELLNSPIFGLVGTVLGLVFTFVFYLRSKRDKEPHWAIQTVNLFKDYSGTVAGLDIQYLGEKVRDLSVSKVAFWNRGALTIDSDDLTRTDPLRLEAKKGRILSTKLISTNNAASNLLISASPEKDRAFLEFEYLDRRQGFVVQAIHEGTSSDDLKVKGVIKGAAQIRNIDLSSFINKTKTERSKELLWIFSAILIFLVLVPTFWYGAWLLWLDSKYYGMGLLAVSGLYFLSLAFRSGKILLKLTRQVPAGLESFYTDPRQP